MTDGAGFLGIHFCERLLSEGHRVVLCLDSLMKSSEGKPVNLGNSVEQPVPKIAETTIEIWGGEMVFEPSPRTAPSAGANR